MNDRGLSLTAKLLVPTNGAFFFAYLLLLFLFWKPMQLLGDGAIARHILTGQYVLQHHALPTQNYVWAIDPSAPWVTHEVLGDLILGGTANLLGLNGVDLLAAVIVALTISWCYQFGRLRGIGNTSGLLMLIAVMGACSIHWSARAHLLSYVPFMLSYFLLFISRLELKTRVALMGLNMFLWANIHGSFVFGLFMIGLKLLDGLLLKDGSAGARAGDVAANASASGDGIAALTAGGVAGDGYADSELSKKERIRVSCIFLVVSLVTSTLNVRGIEFLKYIFSYATNPMIRFASDESRMLDFSQGMPVAAFLILGLFVFVVWFKSKKLPALPDLGLGVALFGASIYSMRIIPYFSLLSLALVGAQWAALRSRIIESGADKPKKNAIENFCLSEQRIDSEELQLVPAQKVALAVSVLASIVFLVVPAFHIADFDPNRLPVAAASQPVYVNARGLGYNYDNWGDYLYWRNQRPVFIDEKTDFYDQAFLKDYTLVYTGGPDFERVLDKYKIDWILVPKILPLVERLSATKRWKVDYKDDLSAFLTRVSQP